MNASYGVVRRETSTLSSDGHSWLRMLIWLPDSTYTRRGIVQIIHGMSEHIGRYDHFARFLAGLGYVVFGHDHIGHGKSASSANDLGCLPLQGGKDILVEDVLRVREAFLKESGLKLSSLTASPKKPTETQSSHTELPLFLFGHSMGSYIARVIAARYPQNTAGVVLCGAGNQPAFVANIGTILSRVVAAVKGQEYRSPLLYSLVSGSFI